MITIDRIEDAWAECTRCPLSQCGRRKVVVGAGPTPCQLMLVGEGPGEAEDERGIPFIGPAGKLLRFCAQSQNIDLRTEAYITNMVGCRPPDNRIPLFNEIDACRARLEQLAVVVQPKVILILGGTALMALTGKQGITRARGKWLETEWTWKMKTHRISVIPTFHPAGLLPNRLKEPRDLELFKSDIKSAYDRAYGE